MNKKILSFILVLIWCLFIFVMSNMDTFESNNKSKMIIENLFNFKSYINIKNDSVNNNRSNDALDDIDEKIKSNDAVDNNNDFEIQKRVVIDKYNIPFRKFAHAFEFFILTLFLINLFKCYKFSNIKVYLISLILCFIYACLDEIHQLYIPGRTSQFSDVLIDTFGSIMGILFTYYFNKIKLKYFSIEKVN